MKTFIIIFLFTCLTTFGQNQANIWYFGKGAGLDFNNGCTPKILTDGKIDGHEGCATISDKTSGQLLFYTNSDSVWNRNHQVMPNGHLVKQGKTITQVLIIQKPFHDSIFYIITSEIQGFSGEGLRFHEINMSLNGGLGGFVFKDSVLYSSPVTEKLTAIQHANTNDVWLIAHEYNSNKFLSFLASSSGINKTPIISQIGKIHYDNTSYDAIGEMKASPDGAKLATVTLRQPNIELFDFNNSTGQINNLITLPENGAYDLIGNSSGLYGLSFSSNNSFLYVSKWNVKNSPGQIIQFNISSNDSTQINNSRVNIFTSTTKNFYSLKLAPNRKIYVGKNASTYLGVINSPDSAGLYCNYVDSGLYLNGKIGEWGLNNLMEYGNYCLTSGLNEKSTQTISVTVYPNPFSQSATIKFENLQSEKYHLQIYNALGQQIFSMNEIRTNIVSVEKSNLSAGIYYFQLITDRINAANGKFIIE